ncbi:sulfotransferase [Janibacter corallicola]|uniref:sulfotransferase n=1 Tax=Janibacter corallicola TaxID=415212 RepID=UPI000A066189|nr:sulfotransferase [Janibacter corallicola]
MTNNCDLEKVRPPAILVTGVPRSGTTWLARLLATAPGTAMTGREPMNPGARQYSLGGTLEGWSRLQQPSPRQKRALRSAYRGVNPFVYSRYGRRQWAAPFSRTRLIMKDPFAMLSISAIRRVTRARAILIYRHPGAVLASYRRMGWAPDLDQIVPILRQHPDQTGDLDLAHIGLGRTSSEAAEMGLFWAGLHSLALGDVATTDTIVLAHDEIAAKGADAAHRLFDELGLCWNASSAREFSSDGRGQGGGPTPASQSSGHTLHHFDRAPAAVAHAWREQLTRDELVEIEEVAGPTLARLDAARFRLHGEESP